MAFENHGQGAELVFHKISSEIYGKLREVWPVTTPRSGWRLGHAQLGEPRVTRLSVGPPGKGSIPGLMNHCLADELASSRPSGFSGPTGMYS
jgi:hypothetical protein